MQFNPVTSGGAIAQTQFNPSLITSAPIASFTVASPSASILGSLLGNQTDVAQSVAQQIGAISQAPTFQYSPVKYGAASYVDGSIALLNTANDGVNNLRTIMNGAPFNTPSASLQPLGSAGAPDDPNANYSNIVVTTRALLDDINKVESSALIIESAYLKFRDRIVSLEARIAQLTDTMASARDTLRSSQATCHADGRRLCRHAAAGAGGDGPGQRGDSFPPPGDHGRHAGCSMCGNCRR